MQRGKRRVGGKARVCKRERERNDTTLHSIYAERDSVSESESLQCVVRGEKGCLTITERGRLVSLRAASCAAERASAPGARCVDTIFDSGCVCPLSSLILSPLTRPAAPRKHPLVLTPLSLLPTALPRLFRTRVRVCVCFSPSTQFASLHSDGSALPSPSRTSTLTFCAHVMPEHAEGHL